MVKKTEGYSGADIANVCHDAAFMPMRRVLKKEGGVGNKLNDARWLTDFEKEVQVPYTMEDFMKAIMNVKPSVGKNDLANYEEWMKEFGEQGTN
jgi:katanin p60 ATPase-containing subunit A1